MRKPLTLLLWTLVACGGGASGSATDQRSSRFVQQALVHSIQPAQRNGVPVIMVPGANLASSIYLATPDGREGWAQRFAEAGFDVHVINDPNFDWSRGFGDSPFLVPAEGGPASDPTAERAWQRDIWRRWGFGESEGVPYPDTRFPTADFASFEAAYPFPSGAGRSYSDALIALLEEVGPAVLLAHSAGGPRAVTAALARPDLVTGLILIEPTGPPDAGDFPALAGLSMFGVYGDYVDSRNQGNRKIGTEAAAALFASNGGVGDVVSLPDDYGLFGNTHLMMQDDNNGFIADLILAWIDSTLLSSR